MILSNKLYDFLKQIANIWLPISITVVTAAGQIYNFSYSTAVIVLTAIETCIGIFVANSSKAYAKVAAASNGAVMTSQDFCNRLYKLTNRPNKYDNHYPKNLCYYDGEKISTDCYCLIKSIIWDPDIVDNYTEGKFARVRTNVLGDYTIAQMMNICTETSTDFSDLSNIPAGAILQYDTSLGQGGHAGVYVGDGKVIESTTAWGGGILVSEIDCMGNRSKNGKGSGRWMKWGLLPQIEFPEEPTPEPPKPEVFWHRGDQVTLNKGAKVYGKSYGYKSWVYNAVLTVIEDSRGDRAVIGTASDPVIGPVYTYDLTEYVAPHDPEDDNIIDSEGRDVEKHWLTILIEALVQIITDIFNKK